MAGPRRKISDSLLVPSLNRAANRLKPQTSCPESCYTKAHATPLCHQTTSQSPQVVNKRGAWSFTADPGPSTGTHRSSPAGVDNPSEHPTIGGPQSLTANALPRTSQSFLRKQIAIREELDPQSDSTSGQPHVARSTENARHGGDSGIQSTAATTPPHVRPKEAPTAATTKPKCPHTSCGCYTDHLNTTQQKLKEVEEAKQRLLKENHFLLEQLESAYRELNALREHVGEVRQHTVSFILGQMETLHIQKDTHL